MEQRCLDKKFIKLHKNFENYNFIYVFQYF